MPKRVSVMSMIELVELVNEWGTRPREKDGRPPADGQLTVVADYVHPVFAGENPAGTVSDLLKHTGVRPELSEREGHYIEDWFVDDATDEIIASAALALRHQLAEHAGRIGVCADDQCADVWVDGSPAGRRRYCCLTCQNRARATAFRRKQKQKQSQEEARPAPG